MRSTADTAPGLGSRASAETGKMLRFLGVFIPSIAGVAVVLISAYVFANRLVETVPASASAHMSGPTAVQQEVAPKEVTESIGDADVAANETAELPSGIDEAAMTSPVSERVAAGERAFRKCRACHQVGEDAKNRAGPTLNGVVGRVAASVSGFNYSKAMKAAGMRGLIWNEEELAGYLAKPRVYLRGTKMSFAGLKSEDEIAATIAYLKSFSESPVGAGDGDASEAAPEVALDSSVLDIEGDPEYGEYLSSECTTCHQADGDDDGIPSIVRWAEDRFVTVMHAYKLGVREHPVMNMVAGRLGNEEIAALAAYFAALED